MQMGFYVLVFWFALPHFFVQGQRYYPSEQETQRGQSNCTLAFLSINYTDRGIFAETKHNANLALPKKGLWIGLFQAQLSFAYVGCNEIHTSDAILVHNISECRWKSGCNTFAVRKTYNEKLQCKCFDLSDVSKETNCTSTCESVHVDYNCGQERHNYFSVYTVENITQCFNNCNKNNRKCLRFKPNSENILSWWKCVQSEPKRIVCSDLPDINGTVQDIMTTVNSSADAGEKCFAKGMFPATLRHIQSSSISTSKAYWTGIFRMNSLIRTDDTFHTDNPKLYAYVQLNGSRLEVRFDEGSSVTRKSLCETTNFVTTTATATEGHSTSTSKNPETNEDTRTKSKVDQRVPVAEISASVSALVVVGIFIVIVVILRKREWLRCFDDSKTTKANKESTVEYINTDFTESQTRDRPNAYPNQGYSMTEELPISTENKSSGKAHMMYDYVGVNKGPDGGKNPQDVQPIATVHSNVNQGLEENDHFNKFGIPSQDISHPINNYDSTIAAIGENQDDTYNHLNERPQQRRTTENVYGVQNKNETIDIYNQLNERPERKHKMENIYGLQDKNETENQYDITVEKPGTCKNMSENASGVNYDKVNKNW